MHFKVLSMENTTFSDIFGLPPVLYSHNLLAIYVEITTFKYDTYSALIALIASATPVLLLWMSNDIINWL